MRFCVRAAMALRLLDRADVSRTLRFLTPEDDQLLGDLATRLVYSPGDVLVREGKAVDALYVLRRGTVRLERRGRHDEAALAWLGPTDVLGEAAVLGGEEAPLTAVAESEVHVDVLDSRVLGEAVATRPAFAARLFRGVAHALHERLGTFARREP
jgi:CRP-like cAMP-binding protein